MSNKQFQAVNYGQLTFVKENRKNKISFWRQFKAEKKSIDRNKQKILKIGQFLT